MGRVESQRQGVRPLGCGGEPGTSVANRRCWRSGPVISVILAMIVIVALASATVAVVLVGIEDGGGRWSADLAERRLRQAAQHLNDRLPRPTR